MVSQRELAALLTLALINYNCIALLTIPIPLHFHLLPHLLLPILRLTAILRLLLLPNHPKILKHLIFVDWAQ